jgi:hypothetical protein
MSKGGKRWWRVEDYVEEEVEQRGAGERLKVE